MQLKITAYLMVIVCMLSVIGISSEYESRAMQQHEQPVKLSTALVTVPIIVSDTRDRCISNLIKENFEVYEEKVKQKIDHFGTEDAPASVGIIFDTSGSMTTDKIIHAKQALRAFLIHSHRDDDYFLITVGDKPKLVQDFTANSNTIASGLAFPATNQATALYDAVQLGLEKVQRGKHKQKMALIVISDGQDNHSRRSYKEIRKTTQEAGVVIYSIGVTTGATDALESYGKSVLEELAHMTGGRAFFPRWDNDLSNPGRNNHQLLDIATRIATELRHQYVIGYYPDHDAFDGQCYKIKIKVSVPPGIGRVSVRSKERYCNPKSVQSQK